VVPRPLPTAALVAHSRVIGRCAQEDARGAAQVLHRGAQAAARGAATLSQHEKNNSVVLQRAE
jgi:hypothetical protein